MLPLILVGGMVPLAVAYSLGRLCFRRAPDVLALAAGASIESVIVFGLLAAGIAKTPVFVVLAALALAPLAWLRPRLSLPLPRHPLLLLILSGYGVLYLIHALAPEIQSDALTYHLALVAEYGRIGGFAPHIDFYSMLPQGMEMLFLFAFAIGKYSAAKLVNLGFLLATIPLMLEIGRRFGLSERISGAAAALYFCAPVVGLTGTSTYNDATLVFFTLATLLALLLWKQERDDRYLLAAGLVAGFCYALKMSGALIPVLAVGLALLSRRLRPALTVAAAAAIPILPWLARNTLMTGNPFAPLATTIFPNPYFHPLMERNLKILWANYSGFTYRAAPWQLTVGDKLQGTFGAVFLLTPIGLLALRKKAGRWIWLAAVLVSLPWLSNVGARFIMPSAPFLALAMTMSLDSLASPLLWAVVALHAVSCLPNVSPIYQPAYAWRLPDLPWRAALRLESERDYLTRTVSEYQIAAEFLTQNTRPDETTFTLVNLPNAYKNRTLVDTWESGLAERLTDTLSTANWRYDLRADWPAESLKGLRFRVAERNANEWDVNEIRLFSGSDRVYNSPHWILNAWPNPWESPLAFDDNFASRWRTWQPRPAGSFIEVLFDHPQRLTTAMLTTHEPAFSKLRVEFYGLRDNGEWKLLSAKPSQNVVPVDARLAATRYLKRSGISYILAPSEAPGVWQLGKILLEQQREFGLEDVGQVGAVHLLRIRH
jgi:hypothetical protein